MKSGVNLPLSEVIMSRLLDREVCSGLPAYVIVGAEVQSMENTIATEISLKTRADYKAAIAQCLAEMQRLHEQMARDQEDIDRLRAETKALLAALQVA
jgi:seryl-tRNA synthetase